MAKRDYYEIFDVYVTEKIPYTTAILGGEAEFQTLYGRVKCKVPAGSQSGTKIRLGGKGIASAKGKGRSRKSQRGSYNERIPERDCGGSQNIVK